MNRAWLIVNVHSCCLTTQVRLYQQILEVWYDIDVVTVAQSKCGGSFLKGGRMLMNCDVCRLSGFHLVASSWCQQQINDVCVVWDRITCSLLRFTCSWPVVSLRPADGSCSTTKTPLEVVITYSFQGLMSSVCILCRIATIHRIVGNDWINLRWISLSYKLIFSDMLDQTTHQFNRGKNQKTNKHENSH